MDSIPSSKHKWFRTWWGILFIIIMSLIAVILASFIFLTVKYWRAIRQGRGDEILQQLRGNTSQGIVRPKGFTASPGSASISSRTVDRSRVETADDPYLGRESAPLVIVEFVDFKCPNCKTAAPIMYRVIQQFGSRIKLIVRDFPIESIHPGATEIAELAFCASRQNRFWEMHDLLYADQETLSASLSLQDLQYLASRSGADITQLQACLKTDAAAAEVRKDYLDGLSAGVRGTPTFFINGERVEGVVTFEEWERYLEKYPP